MPSNGHSAAPRPGGGFNAGMGQFGEHLDEAAMMKAMQQKSQQQQKASTTTVPTPLNAQNRSHQPSRDVGSFSEELFQRPLQDLWEGIKSMADLDMWLGIEPTPEQEQERARKEVILKRFNQLTDEEQSIAKQRYQEHIQRQQAEEEEKHMRKQREEQQSSLVMPSKAPSGPVGPGMSGKQKASAQLNWDRQRSDQAQKVG